MPKAKRRYHDHRGDGGRFAPRPSTNGTPALGSQQFNPATLDTLGRGGLAGVMPGWWISDHMQELKNFFSWIYVGVHKIAQLCSQATCNVYDTSEENLYGMAKGLRYKPQLIEMAKYLRRMRVKSAASDSPSEQFSPIPDHPVAQLLKNPNPYTSGRMFMYQWSCQLRLTGGCYIWEVPSQFATNGQAEPAELYILPRGWCRPMPPTGPYPLGGFSVTPIFNSFTQNIASPSPTSSTFFIPYEQMIFTRYYHPLYPGEGTSPSAACSQMIDIMQQLDTATWAGLLNSVKPSLVMNVDPKNQQVSPEMLEQLLQQIATLKAGPNNAGKILAMIGLTVQQLMTGPSDLDYVNGRQQLVEHVLAVHGVSPTVVGLTEAANYSSATVAVQCTNEFSVQPDLEVLSADLCKRWEPLYPGVLIEFSPRAHNDPTMEIQWAAAKGQGFTAGVLSANEYRIALKEEPLDDPVADIPAVLMQQILAPAGAPGAGDSEDPYSPFEDGEMDLEDSLASDSDTGTTNPDQKGAPGRNRLDKAWQSNGHFRVPPVG